MNTTNPVGWFEIYVDDMQRATQFYETVLGNTLHALPMPSGAENMTMMAFPIVDKAYGASGALVHMQGFKVGQNSTIVYFSSEDCALEAARVVDAGGKLQQEKTAIGEYGYIALAYDTEGNMFGIHSMK